MNFNENLTKLVTRGLVAAYLIYLAFKIIMSGVSTQNGATLVCIGIIFLITSVVFIIYTIRKFFMGRSSSED